MHGARLLIICLSLIAISSVAVAQGVYVKRDRTKSNSINQSKPLVPERMNDAAKAGDKTVDVPLAPPPSPEQSAIGNQLFANCIAQDHPILKGDDKELFCGCTSAKAMDVMSPQNIKDMNTDNAEGRMQRNRMLMFVYAPCISYPTRALILNSCLDKKELKNPKGTCVCLADGMSDFIQIEAPGVIQHALKRNPKNLDPMQFLLESSKYKSKQHQVMIRCVSKYEHVR